jgi:IclR family acetate operon transcriptional repressor
MDGSGSLVKRCLRVVELLAQDAGSMPLGEIASRLKLAKSGCHRLLTLMEDAGWIEQDQETGFYRLTLKLAIVGQLFFIATHIPDICQPVLDRLAAQTHALARLALVSGGGLTWMSYAQGAKTGLLYQPTQTGTVKPHVTATGKCWLASLPIDEAVNQVIRAGFGKPDELGPGAVSSIDELIAELDVVRERGWAFNNEEAERGVRAIAAPVKSSKGVVVAVVALAGPALHLSDERIPELVQMTLAAAGDISTFWPLRVLRASALT